jgi:tetratricopeptide (TPR) repeat protein
MTSSSVIVRREPIVLPTYEPLPPDKNPIFLEKRVYQGSSGKVYPLPFYNRISSTKSDRSWDAVYIENEYVKVMILPEIGGRIHIGEDKTNGYDFFYRQNVIKPALVGLAGPWISGGVEFNWPQHHRPGTFMPVDVEIEAHADGSKTVWLSDHDPLERLKGMHGVCLHPGRSAIELKMRAYNRTPFVHSFLWWANVATRVHEGYRSFFPPDVSIVADHAKRAISQFPLCEGHYYGVDYGARAKAGVSAEDVPAKFVPPHCVSNGKSKAIPDYAPNDLSWYANIPVPTSYMCLGSKQDFFGGYDYLKRAGLVQIANHHIAPGKKQWTWGNHDFGYAWDRSLTDTGGPYIELMLGVYTDNQPDFSFLQPGETKAWSVFWYPIKDIGPAKAANAEAAISLGVDGGTVTVGVAMTRARPNVAVELWKGEKKLARWIREISPGKPFIINRDLHEHVTEKEISVRVADTTGEIISYAWLKAGETAPPQPATEPPEPTEVPSTDELFTIGLHLWQYRHATRSPAPYWQEALNRDPGDVRCNNALGLWSLRRGEFAEAERLFRRSIERLISRNPNPYDGEPYYNLGLTLVHRGRFDEAYDALYKATWNQAWQAPGFHALAEIDCIRKDWAKALDHAGQSLRLNTDNLRARNLRALVFRQLDRENDCLTALNGTLALDPLDWWARYLRGDSLTCNTQTRLDLSLDFSRCGFFSEALAVLGGAKPESYSGTEPLVCYYRAHFHEKLGQSAKAFAAAQQAARSSPEYCFPARLEEIEILTDAIARNPGDMRALYYLGNLYYDRRRYDEAILCWEQSVTLYPFYSVVWRNLGIAYFNIQKSGAKAMRAYERARKADPTDARVFYERDQLWKRLGKPVKTRLREFERHRNLVDQRDDASIEFCALCNQVGRHHDALAVLNTRKFQPWEGGEGQALGQYVRTQLALGQAALRKGDPSRAIKHFAAAKSPPDNLSEVRHLLANQSDIYFWLGEACAAAGRNRQARDYWTSAARSRGDFQEMSVRSYSEMSYYSARSLERLGKKKAAHSLFREIATYAMQLSQKPAKIDYFATSLPTMLLFDDNLQHRQNTAVLFLRAQSELGLGRRASAKKMLKAVLSQDPSHALAADLLAEF